MTPQQIIDGIVRVAPKYGMQTDYSGANLKITGKGNNYWAFHPGAFDAFNAGAAWMMLEALKEKWKGRPLYSSVIPEHIERLSFLMRDYIAGLTIDRIVTDFIRVGDLLPDPVQRCEKCGQVVSE